MEPEGSRRDFTHSPSAHVESVFVVDDSPAIQATVEDALDRLGLPSDRVTVLDTGDDALAVFTPLSPDLVLLDTSMPSIDPFDVVQAMLLEAPQTQIVPLTEKELDHPSVRELISYGAFDVLRKPIRVKDLETLFRSIEEQHPGAGRIP